MPTSGLHVTSHVQTCVWCDLCFLTQGKLEAEQRQQLIEKGQQLKVALEGIESKLVQVRRQQHSQQLCMMTTLQGCW